MSRIPLVDESNPRPWLQAFGLCSSKLALYAELSTYFEPQQMVDLCLTVGVSNMINRFHATFLTDVDERTLREVEAGNVEPGVCPIPMPERPT